jgi:hypothetical protein
MKVEPLNKGIFVITNFSIDFSYEWVYSGTRIVKRWELCSDDDGYVPE